MNDLVQVMTVEQFVACEKIATAAGFDSVASWLSSFVDEKVGHTFLPAKR